MNLGGLGYGSYGVWLSSLERSCLMEYPSYNLSAFDVMMGYGQTLMARSDVV